MLRRGYWDEITLGDDPDALVLAHPGWVRDRESLALAIRETGWLPTTRASFEAAESAELKWAWVGLTDERTLVICDSEGLAVGTGDAVSDVFQVTLARIGNSA